MSYSPLVDFVFMSSFNINIFLEITMNYDIFSTATYVSNVHNNTILLRGFFKLKCIVNEILS